MGFVEMWLGSLEVFEAFICAGAATREGIA